MSAQRPRAAPATLARLGLTPDTAEAGLRSLGLWDGEEPLARAWPLIDAVTASADPDRALAMLVRLAERRPQVWAGLAPDLVARAAVVAGASEALGELIITSPEALEVLIGDLSPWAAADLADRARGELAAAEHGPATALASAQRRGLLRIAARDLLGLADTPSVAGELAALAEAMLSAALGHVAETTVTDARQRPRLAVVGMGKLGGRELNYVSDIDVLFVHDGDWAVATRICERLLRLLGEVTPAGQAYEVDTNLRPEGRDGPLVRSLDSYRAYYERWAKTWEFQALLKARPVAGDAVLGRAFVETAEPFVWPDRLDAAAVDEIQQLKGVVEESPSVRRAGGRQVKLGPGGLRDIEFAVQLLQLVHGRHNPALRSGNTLAALAALAEGGYVGDDDAAAFRRAYVFLRTVEHRLQLLRLRRTHTLPTADADRSRLAHAVGFADTAETSAAERFDAELRRVRGLVRRLHEKLFFRPLLSRFAELGADAALPLGLGAEAARERLAALGFADPTGALRHLDALAEGVSRRARLLRTLLPAVLPTLASSPDPDGGLAAFRGLADRLGESPFFLQTLRDNPPVGEMLAGVLGSSRLVGEWLERQPEVFGILADLPGLARRLDPADYRRVADGLLRRREEAHDAADALRRVRRREVVRVAVRDLSGQADVGDVSWELSGIAEACLEAAVALAVGEGGSDGGLTMAVIGLGKLGGRELGYSSDLDVMLVFEPADAREQANRAAAALLSLLGDITPEGQAFRVDPNLRPEGKDGPLARTVDSYRSYYERWGDHWEMQALTQARPVAGDPGLGAAFVDAVADLVYPQRPPAERLVAVRRMKARVERERAGGGQTSPVRLRTPRRPARGPARRAAARPAAGAHAGDRIDVKLGAGGLSDIEWTVQLLQLRSGGRLPSLRRPGTLAGIRACEAEGVLAGDDARWLREGWTLLSRVRNALYLAGMRDTDRLPAQPRDTERIARMLGYPRPGTQALLEDLGRTLRRVRKTHQRLFYES